MRSLLPVFQEKMENRDCRLAVCAASLKIMADSEGRGSVADFYTHRAFTVEWLAKAEAHKGPSGFVFPEHYLLGILQAPESNAFVILTRCGVSVEDLEAELRQGLRELEQDPQWESERAKRVRTLGENWWRKGIRVWSEPARRFERRVRELAEQGDSLQWGTYHMLVALAEEQGTLAGRLLAEKGVTVQKIKESGTDLGHRETF
jgi:ATP-dependent Clp protease ATP-binding subunit ClpA